MHFSIINTPNQYVLDEEYYVQDARAVLQGEETLRPEHAPLGKIFFVAGLSIFGDNMLGWRFFPIICGTLCILLFYLICRRLKMSKWATLSATFLLTLENMSFVQASIAMLDIFLITFMLACFWLYLRYDYPFAILAGTLGTLVKLNGALVFPVIGLHWLLMRRDRLWHFLSSAALAPLSFILLIPLFALVTFHKLVDPFWRINTILLLSSSLTVGSGTHPYITRPWDWLVYPHIMPYFYDPNYMGAISLTVWAFIIPTAIYMAVRAIKRNEAAIFGSLWFVFTYLTWIPLVLITDRITYIYYFYHAVGAICLGLGLGIGQLIDIWQQRKEGKLRWVAISSVGFFLALHIASFILLSPFSPLTVPPFLE
jgi:predicted membrane-bound dolichyl-phosphate-mannose-protein mannosyltransferase